MNIPLLKKFLQELEIKMAENPEDGLSYFQNKWVDFDNDQRNVLKGTIAAISTSKMIANPDSYDTLLYWMAILNYAQKEIVDGQILDDSVFPRLQLNEGVHGNQITRIFRDLKTAGHIISSHDLIAEAISIIFPIELSTAYKDLTEVSRLANVKKLNY